MGKFVEVVYRLVKGRDHSKPVIPVTCQLLLK